MELGFSSGGSATAATDEGFRIAAFADFGTAEAAGPRTIAQASDLGELLKGWQPKLCFHVDNHFINGGEPLLVQLTVAQLKHLRPKAIVAASPLLTLAQDWLGKLDEIRRGKRPLAQLSAFTEHCREWTALASIFARAQEIAGGTPAAAPTPEPAKAAPAPSEPPAGDNDDAVARIMGMVAEPDVEQQASSAVGRLIGSMVKSKKRPKEGPAAVAEIVEGLRDVYQAQIAAILANQDYQRLERNWLGLNRLASSGDLRRGVRIDVYSAPTVEAQIKQLEALAERQIDQRDDVAVGMVLMPSRFQSLERAVTVLEPLVELVDRLQVPLVTSLAWRALGDVSERTAWKTHFEGAEFLRWHQLRGKHGARYVTVACNSYLLRERWEVSARRSPEFEERWDDGASLPWGDGVWIVGALAAQSYARVGWPTELTGREDGTLSDFPVRRRDIGGREVNSPLELHIGGEALAALHDAGILALTSASDTDRVMVLHDTNMAQASDSAKPANRSGLGYRLACARIVQAVRRDFRQLTRGVGSDEAEAALAKMLTGLVAETGAGAWAEVKLKPGSTRMDRYLAEISVRTGRGVLRGAMIEVEHLEP